MHFGFANRYLFGCIDWIIMIAVASKPLKLFPSKIWSRSKSQNESTEIAKIRLLKILTRVPEREHQSNISAKIVTIFLHLFSDCKSVPSIIFKYIEHFD